MIWIIATEIVRTIIVKNKPATAKGMATAIAVPICLISPPLWIKIIVEATAAKAASGATAAPMLAQPRAIICKEPPSMTQGTKWPVTKPINVQAISGWWNWNSSKTPSIPAKNATITTKIIEIADIIKTPYFFCSSISFWALSSKASMSSALLEGTFLTMNLIPSCLSFLKVSTSSWFMAKTWFTLTFPSE